jgi:hypothetical protein
MVILPVLAVPAVAAIMRGQLDGWRGAELGRARIERKRGRLGRDGGQNYCAHKGQDYSVHFLKVERWLKGRFRLPLLATAVKFSESPVTSRKRPPLALRIAGGGRLRALLT